MNQSQLNAIKLVREILNEHFDSGVIAVRITDENMRSQFPVYYGGHLSEAIGLAAIAKETLELKFRMGKVIEEDTGEKPNYE